MRKTRRTVALPHAALLRLLQRLLRFLWWGLIPALAAALLVRETLPFANAGGAVLRFLFAHDHFVWSGLALFLLLVALARYWWRYLPGGRYLSPLAPGLAGRLEARALPVFVSAAELAARLKAPRVQKQVLARLSGEAAASFAARLEALAASLRGDDPAEIEREASELAALVRPELKRHARDGWVFLALGSALALVLALLVQRFAVQIYEVEGSSMLPSLEPGQYVLATRLGSAKPQRGDLVLAAIPGAGASGTLVKRVLGLPGDRIEARGGLLIINGSRLPDCDAGWFTLPGFGKDLAQGRVRVEYWGDAAYPTLRLLGGRNMEGEYVVKPGEVFVVGDHRHHSLDSRFLNDGRPTGIPVSAIEGRVERLLARPRPDGSLDFSDFWQVPGARLRVFGVNVEQVEAAAAKCAKERPAQTLISAGGG
jgi:signal peptidase I